jgi:hypothetical protein
MWAWANQSIFPPLRRDASRVRDWALANGHPELAEPLLPADERRASDLRLRGSVTGQPHRRDLDRRQSLVGNRDVLGLHRMLTGLDRDSIEMREASPMGGLLPQDERQAALREAADETRPA